MVRVLQPPAPDCMIMEPWGLPSSQVLAVRERKVTPTPCSRNRERTAESEHSLRQSPRKKKKVPTPECSGSDDGSWEQTGHSVAVESDEEVTPSPSMRKIFTQLQERRLLTPGGGASGISGPTGQSKAGTSTKKH